MSTCAAPTYPEIGAGKRYGGYLGKGAAQPTLGVLTKLIDSAERLTLQVHPDKPTALRLFQSQYGKTECWHILSGHPVNGEEPCIYYASSRT